eukprot:403359093
MGMYVSSDRSQTQIYIGMKRTNEAFFSLMIFNIKVYENTSIELTFDKLIKIGSQQCASTISSSDYLLILGCPSFNNQLGLMTTLRRNDLYEINTINGALNNTQLLGKQIKILFRPEIQENQETVFFSSQNKSDNQGFIGVMQVFHDRRAYNFTYEWYDIQSLNQYNEKVFGYSFAINNKGDTFSTSLVQQYQSVGYVKFCMSNQYYFDGSCQQCGGSNTLSSYWQDNTCMNCDAINQLNLLQRYTGLSVCDYTCGDYDFGPNCQVCSMYKQYIIESAPKYSVWDDTQSNICTFKCANGYIQSKSQCQVDENSNSPKLILSGEEQLNFPCKYNSDCFNCTKSNQCQWCPSTFQCKDFNETIPKGQDCSAAMLGLDKQSIVNWFDQQPICTRRFLKCGSTDTITMQSKTDSYKVAFKYSLELNDFCQWKIQRTPDLQFTPIAFRIQAPLTYAEFTIRDQNNKVLLDTQNLTIKTQNSKDLSQNSIGLSNLYFQFGDQNISELTISYRSVKYQSQPPAFIMTIEQDQDYSPEQFPSYMWPVIIVLVIGTFITLVVGILIIYCKKWRKNIYKIPRNRKITIFANGQYRKYIVPQCEDKNIKSKINDAFAKMEELLYSDKDMECVSSLGQDMGKCAICFEAFVSKQPIRKLKSCIHLYHSQCVEQFVINSLCEKQTPRCPLCDSPMIGDERI